MSKQKSFNSRVAELVDFAKSSRKNATHWTDLHNAVYGIGGKTYELFPSRDERVRLMKSEAAAEIRKVIESLPASPTQNAAQNNDASGRILLRVPKSLHVALLAEAERENISLNQLLLAKVSLPLQTMM